MIELGSQLDYWSYKFQTMKMLTDKPQIFMFSILLFTPAAGGTDCYYRHVLVAFPIFIMIGTALNSSWRKFILPVYAIICLYLTFQIYLPLYKMGELM